MPINHVVFASSAVAAVSIAVATALAVLESPELQRYAGDVRRRVAMALHSIGSGIDPSFSPRPRFNRPEDADGFLTSRNDVGVDADDESRRRQREELMYWNNLRLEKQREPAEKEAGDVDETPALQQRPAVPVRGPSFDDFLRRDARRDAEQGALIFQSGVQPIDLFGNVGVHHRGEAPRGYPIASYCSNPFADENHIGSDEVADMMAPTKSDDFSDIYSATTYDDVRSVTLDVSPPPVESESIGQNAASRHTLELPQPGGPFEENVERESDIYSSIQAWASNPSQDFYSPLPTTPVAPISECDMVSDGQLTPTDSVSSIGSGEDIAHEAQSSHMGDVMSVSEGIHTPASWSEIGSVVSDNDGHDHA